MSGLLKKARAGRKAVQAKVGARVTKRREQLHQKRVAATQRVRGKRADGRLGKTELEARMYEAARYDQYALAALLKDRLAAVREAKAALADARLAKDFTTAEALDAKLIQLTEREPFEAEVESLYAAWAETHPHRAARLEEHKRMRDGGPAYAGNPRKDGGKGRLGSDSGSGSNSGSSSSSSSSGGSDDGGADANAGPSLVAGISHRLHIRKVSMVHRLRGKRKDGGLGKTELEAMAYEAESKGEYAVAALLLSRCRALHDAKLAKKKAVVNENFAEAEVQTKIINSLRARDPFMAEVEAMRKDQAVSDSARSDAAAADDSSTQSTSSPGSNDGVNNMPRRNSVVERRGSVVEHFDSNSSSPIVVSHITPSQAAAGRSPYADYKAEQDAAWQADGKCRRQLNGIADSGPSSASRQHGHHV
ncbi:uncharacterized protein AMSG_03583 [Thecamonas trahens ATCC 50062]|uniref:Uncharacterized protein n=1 Tax=Thecamonas trahens ATCC 50062 TaxID=461836 RepID=A0A0L0D4J5_THETB|nr:hypothetical protein AMSG_03583 [Thecamonas trahens ATCC 50062]KNC47155.1 hypothetical protein AMSG_03583 [Thecamonas trahens ATCC 50062]|eukprot:XP_013759929.1 hypothetical protein AMSG_03583 [Thecamonas trahens ATCC 50062]